MFDLIREAPLGQLVRFLSGNKFLKYPEERADFELPQQYRTELKAVEAHHSPELTHPSGTPVVDMKEDQEIEQQTHISNLVSVGQDDHHDLEGLRRIRTINSVRTVPYSEDRMRAEENLRMQRTQSIAIVPQTTSDGVVLVDWYTTDDPANPQNWSNSKKYFVLFVMCFYTFTVYAAGPIYATAEHGVQEHFGVSAVTSTLGLSLYILAYGVGDLLFSPLSEIPSVGRNHVYYITYIIFWILSFPEAVVDSFGGLLALRFLLGFFGSPALANGGATVADMFSLIYVPFGLCWWVFSAWAGPAFGPLIGGFAAQAKSWRWPLWEIVWMASPALVLLLTVMPETSSDTILLRRAQRLRKLTGNRALQSQSEIAQHDMKPREVLFSALVRPIEIMMKDPSIFFVNVYTGYFYGVFYTFFEVFPLVFPVSYGFNLGETGLAFLSCLIGVSIAIALYFAYLQFYMIPDNIKNGFREQEHRLVPAIVGSFLLPIGLFIFAWTARSSIHWVVPLIGVAIFCIGHFWMMQSLFIYIPFSYPQYAASLFAGNSIWRSGIACGSVIFARPLFINLGVDKGVTLLGGLSIVGIFGTTAIYVFGKKLRARSKFAQS
ncbi:major facilitator superfamily transporter [Fusarium beomiforme]|uniref:Major facilitator superfamily transporter n=1 Tax=Fusarium beomiforme TaxID=44412 RepID=A0A9P5AVS3_9HYPO|nr:major facilitator superfamily transporter [Fusarium beomiforme]